MSGIVITGATGYIGRHLVARLVLQGERPRCLLRPGSQPAGLPIGSIDVVHGDITDRSSVEVAMKGAERVIHAAAVVANIKQSRTVNYRAINELGTANVVAAAKAGGVRHFIHIGGMNTVPGEASSYIRTRYNGELHVKNGRMPYTILQPSILFGDRSAFFATLSNLARLTPVVPVPGGGKMRFQPIWVEDVVTCLTILLTEDGRDESIPIGGPAVYTYDQLLDLIFKSIGKRRLKVHLPLPFMRLATGVVQSVLPKPPVTSATLELFEQGLDNITSLDAVPARFGFKPKSLEAALREARI